MKGTVLAAMLAFAFAHAVHATPSDGQVNALVKSIEAHGCRVTEANNVQVLRVSGLTEDEATEVVDHLLETRQAVNTDNELHLKTGKCR
ncbi:MAG TPA: hypothetical protein VFR34_07250 [Paracoccaceae bacterium]|nr:hypothetical protein [Paracoccaceae bacterium]